MDIEKRLSTNYFANKSPGEKSFDDLRIQDEIWQAIREEDGVDMTEIEVDVKDGFVLLTGTVSTEQLKGRVEHKIVNVDGVTNYKSDIRVLKKYPDVKK